MIKKIIHKAYSFSEAKHQGQVRSFSGLPYFTHPKYVARIVEELTGDPELTAVALLHDTLEDTDTTYEELELEFGKGIANMVLELTNRKEDMLPSKKEYLAKKLVYVSSDALTVKLADRYHNVLFLESDDVTRKFIKRYSDETDHILTTLRDNRSMDTNQKTLFFAIRGILYLLRARNR